MHQRFRRTAFTLIELLVVIAIIAILIGLLIPAVQKVRDSAASTQCKNNLKQMSLAVHSYHDANQVLPANGGVGYSYNTTSYNDWSWLARILPYIEQGNLYNSLQVTDGKTANTGLTISAASATGFLTTPVKTFLCPADSTINGNPRTDEANINPTAVGQTNYKGVCGSNWSYGNYANVVGGVGDGLDASNGIFYRSDGYPSTGGHGPLTLSSIKDGTSNTFMIGEDLPAFNIHCDWPFFNHATGTCAIPLNFNEGTANKGDWPNLYSFRSNHANGANFAFADGHVAFINNNIPQATYGALATYNTGEAISPP